MTLIMMIIKIMKTVNHVHDYDTNVVKKNYNDLNGNDRF